jgi:hypothetical protein
MPWGQYPLFFLYLFLRILLSPAWQNSPMDQESLDFHIAQNDYYGTLATVLDLLGQDLRRRGHVRQADMLHRLRNDLTYAATESRRFP